MTKTWDKIKRIEIKVQDLFNTLDEKYKYITKDEYQERILAWQFKPSYSKYGNGWIGDKYFSYEHEIPYTFAEGAQSQDWWTVKEFKNKPYSKCIIERK